jgi:glucokinase
MSLACGIDVGGTKILGGVVDDHGTVVEQLRVESPAADVAAIEDAIAGLVARLQKHHEITSVGVGAAGYIDKTRSRVLFAPNLAWRDLDLKSDLEARIDLPVVVENDANAAAWAEWRFGAGAGEEHLVMVNLGTGIGGAVVRGGRLERGRHGMAGEFGHMTVVPGGHRCPCGNRGCWEQYSSGNALVREARELAAAESPIAQPLLDRVDGDVSAITGPLVTEAAQAGDPCAVELLQEIGQWLGLGLANLAAALDPGRFVIGGGVSAAGELLLGPAREAYRRNLTGRGFRPEADITPAALGNTAGLIGAADLARGRARRFRTVKRARVERAERVARTGVGRRRTQWWTPLER